MKPILLLTLVAFAAGLVFGYSAMAVTLPLAVVIGIATARRR